VFLLHDNAPAHTAGVATSAAAELLPHPPFSPFHPQTFTCCTIERAPMW